MGADDGWSTLRARTEGKKDFSSLPALTPQLSIIYSDELSREAVVEQKTPSNRDFGTLHTLLTLTSISLKVTLHDESSLSTYRAEKKSWQI